MMIPPIQWLLVAGVLALMGGLLAFDLHTPLGVANHILYLVPVLLSLRAPWAWFPPAVAGTITLLIIIGGWLSTNEHNVPLWVPISNRAFSIFAIWMPLWYFAQRRQHEQQLERMNQELEQRVSDRTRQLARVNDALVSEVTERMHTERSLEANRQELKRLASQLIQVQEEERRRISRDLHDDVNQRLALIAIELERLDHQIPAPHQDSVRMLTSRVAELSEDIRRLAYTYHPSILDDLGLTIALERLADDSVAHHNIDVRVDCDQIPDDLPTDIATCFYRVAQESLGNIVRHAKASHVDITLHCIGPLLTLSITDNGIGFQPDEMEQAATGLGLVSMKERLRLVGGALTIQSAVGAGTTVQATIPITEPVTP